MSKRDRFIRQLDEVTSEELDGLVATHKEMLATTWARRRNDNDVLVLGDLRVPEVVAGCRRQHGNNFPGMSAFAKSRGIPPWLAYTCLASDVADLPPETYHEQRGVIGVLLGFVTLTETLPGLIPFLVIPFGRECLVKALHPSDFPKPPDWIGPAESAVDGHEREKQEDRNVKLAERTLGAVIFGAAKQRPKRS